MNERDRQRVEYLYVVTRYADGRTVELWETSLRTAEVRGARWLDTTPERCIAYRNGTLLRLHSSLARVRRRERESG